VERFSLFPQRGNNTAEATCTGVFPYTGTLNCSFSEATNCIMNAVVITHISPLHLLFISKQPLFCLYKATTVFINIITIIHS